MSKRFGSTIVFLLFFAGLVMAPMIAIFLTCQALRKNKNKNKFNVNPRNKSTELEVISDGESGDENDEISYTTINFEDDDEENGKPNPNERQKLL